MPVTNIEEAAKFYSALFAIRCFVDEQSIGPGAKRRDFVIGAGYDDAP